MTDEKGAAEATQSMGKTATQDAPADQHGGILDSIGNIFGGGARGTRMSPGEQMVKSAASAIGREVGRQVLRGVLGGIFGGRR